MIHLVPRVPGVGYLDRHLWLPKTHTSLRQIQSVLSYLTPKGETVKAYEEREDHILVPRNFLAPKTLATRPYPVFDARPRRYPRVSLHSRAVLDAKSKGGTYQTEGAAALLNTTDGILCLRCGAGKTITSLHAASLLNMPILVMVNEKGLAQQWIDVIKWIFDLPEDDIGKCFEGVFRWQYPITVATLHTLAARATDGRLPPEMLTHFGIVIIDECHTVGAPYLNQAVPPFSGRRWGLSATPDRGDEFTSLVRYTLGPVIYSYLMPELMPRFTFRKLLTALDFQNPEVVEAVTDKRGKVHHGKLYAHLSTVDSRVDRIVADVTEAVNRGREVVVLTHSRNLCERLADRFPGGGATHGGVRVKDHSHIVANSNPLIAIMHRGKQALDKPVLDTLYLVEPTTKGEGLQQMMGRILRDLANGATGKDPLVVVYEDIRIAEIRKSCAKIKKLLRTWPSHLGGTIKYTEVKPV